MMRILLKSELYDYAKLELTPIKKIYEKWTTQNNGINSMSYTKVVSHINQLNYEHHNTVTFEKNFLQLFGKMDKSLWTDKDLLITQSLDRANMGGNFSGLELSSGIHLFIESIEMGVVIYAIEKELNSDNIQEFQLAIDWLVKALSEPYQAIKELEVIKLEKELSDNKTTLNNKMKI
jgi:hypothetical protein